jgi:ribulose-phosphate 3-epimerase
VKGCGLDPAAPDRIRRVKEMSPATTVVADGGIRKETVPVLREAGADYIVPGSLYFAAPDRAAIADWWRGV